MSLSTQCCGSAMIYSGSGSYLGTVMGLLLHFNGILKIFKCNHRQTEPFKEKFDELNRFSCQKRSDPDPDLVQLLRIPIQPGHKVPDPQHCFCHGLDSWPSTQRGLFAELKGQGIPRSRALQVRSHNQTMQYTKTTFKVSMYLRSAILD
jgi:hypothetical protein